MFIFILDQNSLFRGEQIKKGQQIVSKNGKYSLAMQHDGNLVIYSRDGFIWQAGTGGRGDRFIMQTDGNAVVYDIDNKAIWATITNKGASLIMQDDGNLVVYDDNNNMIWNSGTKG